MDIITKGLRPSKPSVVVEKRDDGESMKVVTECWNGVVDGLMKAKVNWDKMQEVLAGVPRDLMQNAPIQVQKAALRFRRASFNVMLGRFSDYYRAFGGLEAMKVKGAEDGRKA